MKKLALSLMSVFLLLAAPAAKADLLTLTLSSPFQSNSGSGVLTFDATVTNSTASTLYLNGDSFSIAAPLTLDDSSYNNTFPLSLASGASYTGELFTVDVPVGTPIGLYTGAFEITGGTGSSDGAVISTADFNVSEVPEPSSLLLLATGLISSGLAGLKARRQQTR